MKRDGVSRGLGLAAALACAGLLAACVPNAPPATPAAPLPASDAIRLETVVVPLNPNNPQDRATDWEADIINDFRSHPDKQEISLVRATATGPMLELARPLVNKAACLECHNTAATAPASMVALYGTENGFGWKLNETIGAQIFSVPMSIAESKVWRNMGIFVGITSAIFLVLLVLLNVLLNRYVIGPVRRMAKTAEAVSMGDSSMPEFEYPGADEVASLSRSFNRMRRSLDSAMKMLEK